MRKRWRNYPIWRYQEIVSGRGGGGNISTNETVLRDILLPEVIFLSWTSILSDLKKFRSLRKKDQCLIILMIYYGTYLRTYIFHWAHRILNWSLWSQAVSREYGSADPDEKKILTDSQHWLWGGGEIGDVQFNHYCIGRWVLVACLLGTAALWVQIQWHLQKSLRGFISKEVANSL